MEPISFVLPYSAPESFVVVQGYDAFPTHIKKDAYALDLSQLGCDAYGKPVIASASGDVMLAQPNGYNAGYGAQVLLQHPDGTVTRYAHMVPGSIPVREHDHLLQGNTIGEVGDTGLVAGNACSEHPGTHLHFARYRVQSDGTYGAVKPEPLSGYENLAAGSWYSARYGFVARNTGPSLVTDDAKSADSFPRDLTLASGGVVAGVSIQASSSSVIHPVALASVVSSHISSATLALVEPASVSLSSGGVSSSGGGGSNPVIPSVSTSPLDLVSEPHASSVPLLPLSLMGLNPLEIFNTSTLALDFTWQNPVNASGVVTYTFFVSTSSLLDIATSSHIYWVGTSTSISYPLTSNGELYSFALSATDQNGAVSAVTSTFVAPQWNVVLQSHDEDSSRPVWYNDAWYNLGTGFYGTIRSFTLNGATTDDLGVASHISLDEFLDPGYVTLNKNYTISENAPFTQASTLVTVEKLNIPLQPNKYYRLHVFNDHQNRNVILRGWVATGTSMFDGFVPGVGRVENYYSFYPSIAWTFIPDWPVLVPPNPPTNLSVIFDPADMALNLRWDSATDTDSPTSSLTYEYSVVPQNAPPVWQSVGRGLEAHTSVSFPDVYEVAVRTRDDLDNVSEPVGVSWGFPSGFFVLPSQPDHGSEIIGVPEKFHLDRPFVLTSVALWTSKGGGPYNFGRNYVGVYGDINGSPGDFLASSVLSPTGSPGEVWHDFADPLALSAGDYWLAPAYGPGQGNGAYFYGKEPDQMYYRLKGTFP